MNVLFINKAWDAAGCSILHSKAIAKHTNWGSRHFRAEATFNYPTDITPANYKKDEFRGIMENADVIEWCSADHLYKSVHDFGFDLWEVAKHKKNIFHDYNSFPGQWEERAKDKSVWTRMKDIGYNAIFSSIPQAVHIYESCQYVPDIVDECTEQYTPDPNRDFKEVHLGHYPTGGGNNKNTKELTLALQQVPVDADITQKTVFYDELLKRKRRINLGFDALWRGFHGMTSVENLALGIPTMCRIDESFYPTFEQFHESTERPFDNVVTVDEIAETLKKYKNDVSLLKARAEQVRKFMENVWSFKNVAQKIVKKYEAL